MSLLSPASKKHFTNYIKSFSTDSPHSGVTMGVIPQAGTRGAPPSEMPSSSSSVSAMLADAPPPMPPPPYLKTHLISPSSFKSAVNSKLDRPKISLFRLSIQILQLIFALASGISYAIELSNGNGRGKASGSFVFSQVSFGATLINLIINGATVRYYRFSWIVDWILTVFWFALFAVFYEVYLEGEVESAFTAVSVGRMERAVWCDLINALLWFASSLFSSAMCCSGTKACVKAKFRDRNQKKEKKRIMETLAKMETGTIRD